MSRPNTNTVYKEEVLGKHVEVKFEVPQVGGGMTLEFFAGQIVKYKVSRTVSLVPEGEEEVVEWEHFVVFDDGDKQWFNLGDFEAEGKLKWNDEEGEVEIVVPPAVVSSTPAVKIEPDTAPSSSSASATAVPDAAPSSAVITPPPKKKQKIKRELVQPENVDYESDEINVDDFEYWLRNDHDGQGGGTISERNAKQVMKQAKLLLAGVGIGYINWPKEKVFYKGEKVNLTTDFDAMLDQAKVYTTEKEGHRDKGNGWLLRHPIKKLMLYKIYVMSKRLQT